MKADLALLRALSVCTVRADSASAAGDAFAAASWWTLADLMRWRLKRRRGFGETALFYVVAGGVGVIAQVSRESVDMRCVRRRRPAIARDFGDAA